MQVSFWSHRHLNYDFSGFHPVASSAVGCNMRECKSEMFGSYCVGYQFSYCVSFLELCIENERVGCRTLSMCVLQVVVQAGRVLCIRDDLQSLR